MLIGVVSEPKKDTRFLWVERLLRKKHLVKIKKEVNPFEMWIFKLPYRKTTLAKMSAKILDRKIQKGIDVLKKRGIKTVLLSDEILAVCKEKQLKKYGKYQTAEREYFLKIVPLCIREVAPKCGINMLNGSVCIRSYKMDRISEHLIRQLCFDTKKLTIFAEQKDGIESFCESFYDETGFLVSVSENPGKDYDVLIDTTLGYVKLGKDLYVSEINMGFDFLGYKINHARVCHVLNMENSYENKWVYRYKNIG